MRVQNEIEKLTQFYPVLQELPTSLQHLFAASGYLIQAPAGDILFDVDDTISSFILLTEGAIRVIRPEIDRELLLYRVQPGDCCAISISHLVGDTRCRARAVVESDIRGVALPHPLFRALLEQSPAFCYFVLTAFSDRFNQLIDLVRRVTTMRLDQRLARLLISRGPIIHTTHVQLADDLGSVREVISRILKDFEAKGLIKIERGQIEVINPKTLEEISSNGDSGHRLS